MGQTIIVQCTLPRTVHIKWPFNFNRQTDEVDNVENVNDLTALFTGFFVPCELYHFKLCGKFVLTLLLFCDALCCFSWMSTVHCIKYVYSTYLIVHTYILSIGPYVTWIQITHLRVPICTNFAGQIFGLAGSGCLSTCWLVDLMTI